MFSGVYHTIASGQVAENLYDLFKNAGAKISLDSQDSDHELATEEVWKAKEWPLSMLCSHSS